MSPLSDLLTDLARSESRVAAQTHDGPAELRAVLDEARRAGNRRLAVTLTASAAAVALAVAAATLVPEPLDVAPAQPTGTSTGTATGTATAPAGPAPGAVTRGLIAPLAAAPSGGWLVSPATLAPSAEGSVVPRLARWAGLTYVRELVLDAGATTVLVLGDGTTTHAVGADAATLRKRWSFELGAQAPRGVVGCGGVDTANRLVCLRAGQTQETLQLVDTADGSVADEVPVGFHAQVVAVSGDVAVLHGHDDAGVARWSAVSTRTGDTLWAGEGSAVADASTLTAGVYGPYAVLTGDGTRRVLDLRTGEPVLDDGEVDVGLDVWVADAGAGVRVVRVAEDRWAVQDAQDRTPLWHRADAVPVGVVPGLVLATSGGQVQAYGDRTGELRWTVRAEEGGSLEVLAFDGERVVLAHLDDQRRYTRLSAVDAGTGAVVWVQVIEGRGVHALDGQVLVEGVEGSLSTRVP